MLENFNHPERAFLYSQSMDMQLWQDKKRKVLVIDDDVNFRLAISEILVDQGFQVTTAKDGEAGLYQLLHQERPDLILVDLMMPVKNGLEFRKEQSKLQEFSDIPVVFVTGHGLVEGELCLQKPFEEYEIIRLLNQLF